MRVGGLIVSRKVGEEVVMIYPDKTKKVFKLIAVYSNMATVGLVGAGKKDDEFNLHPNDSLSVAGMDGGNGGIYLESIEGGRASFRFIVDERIKIYRSELVR